MTARIFHILIGLLCWYATFGQEVPRIIHFPKKEYRAQNQNWSMAQRPDRQLFVGNSAGLLQFDGTRWRLHTAPFGQAIRAVQADGSGKIFVGGFETLGYWQAGTDGHFSFHSLLPDSLGSQLANEEIWHILDCGDKVLFQSFSTIFLYDHKKTERISPPGNIMFAKKIGDGVIVPVIGQGLYQFHENGRFDMLPGSEIFGKWLVTDLLPFRENSLLVCTQNQGIFLQDGDGGFSPWQVPINQELAVMQLNKALRLRNGNLVFGTILGGLYITNPAGELLHRISQENGLQNNTVLSLFQDAAGQLWAGLDNGIDLIALDSPLRFFHDKTGETGTVYAAAIFQENLFLGTNQGIFYKKQTDGNHDKLKLIPGSQGQVWDLQVLDGQLIGGHNAGTIRVDGQQVDFIFKGTGVYATIQHPARPGLALQGTYTGIIVLRREAGGKWEMSHGIENFFHSARKLLFDPQNRLWVLHPRKGLFRLTLDDELRHALKTETFDEENGLPSAFGLDMAQVGGEIVFRSGDQFFTFDEAKGSFVKKEKIGAEPLSPGHYLLQGGHGNDWFKIFPNQVVLFSEGAGSVFRLSLVQGSERAVPLPGRNYLFCLDDGYAVLASRSSAPAKAENPPRPIITGLVFGKNQTLVHEPSHLQQPNIFGPSENSLTFHFACPQYTFQPQMRSRLLGFEEKWSALEPVYNQGFTNLSPGTYEFQVQSELSGEIASFRFSILPKWYQTLWAKAGAVLLLCAIFLLSAKWHNRRMEAQKRKLEQQKAQELEQQRILTNNERLQSEVINKSRILADTTMNLIRKNEMLVKIKEELDRATQKQSADPPAKALVKMEHLIEAHLTSEEDWQLFEANFNQLHDQFFKRLKDQYPDLTPGDLRMAAYLKMNLSSKEIAPLLNISLRGVENKRYRLRLKMGLDGEVNLTEYLMGY